MFTLDSLEADASYSRPTPTIAVNSIGQIAFPVREYQIGIFTPDGEMTSLIVDSSNPYPKELLFDDNDILQALSFHEDSIIKYSGQQRSAFPLNELQDWWAHSDQRITDFLIANDVKPFVTDTKRLLGTFLRFPYALEILSRDGLIFVNGEKFIIYDGNRIADFVEIESRGILIGVLDSSNVIFRNTYGASVRNLKKDTSYVISLDNVAISDTLPSGFYGNYPETNKFNLRANWYWARNSPFLYKVSQLPTGYYFYRITFAVQ